MLTDIRVEKSPSIVKESPTIKDTARDTTSDSEDDTPKSDQQDREPNYPNYPTFTLSDLSTNTIFPAYHPHAPPEADSSRCVFPDILRALKAHPSAPIAADSSPTSPLPAPVLPPSDNDSGKPAAENTIKEVHEDSLRSTAAELTLATSRVSQMTESSRPFFPPSSTTFTDVRGADGESAAGPPKGGKSTGGKKARLGRAQTEEWEGDEDARVAFGPGLVFVLFGAFFSVGVLHMCWSRLFDLPFFAIPVSSDAFSSLEVLSLVGDGPFLVIQVCGPHTTRTQRYTD